MNPTDDAARMNFVSDGLSNGRRFGTLSIGEDFSREGPAIEVDTSLPETAGVAQDRRRR